MKKFVVAMVVAAMLFTACGDDSSSSGPNGELVSVESSSSSKKLSSSSVIASEAKQSGSSSAKSSSSSVDPISSSSFQGDKLSSSSSKKQLESSSSSVDAPPTSSETESSSSGGEDKVNCSVLLEGKTGWSWDVPKECRFNPDIDYGTMTDERDGKVYRTVKIGDQTWMAENLNYYDSTDLSVKKKSWCFGKKDNGDSTTCDVAGRLYTWAAAIDSVKLANVVDNPQECGYGKECDSTSTRSVTLIQGVCPDGWHLPSKTEWNALFTAVGGESTAGEVLKSQSGWYNNGNGTDAFGFSALPAGGRNGDGEGYNEGDYAYFWSSTELNSNYAYDVHLGYGGEDAGLLYNIKNNGFSVRCVKNE